MSEQTTSLKLSRATMALTLVLALGLTVLSGCNNQPGNTTTTTQSNSTATADKMTPKMMMDGMMKMSAADQKSMMEMMMKDSKMMGMMKDMMGKDMMMGDNMMEMGTMMKDGKMMMMMSDGSLKPMTKEMMMKDGSKVMMDGKVMMKDGKEMMMDNGDMMMMDGSMMEKMDPSMMMDDETSDVMVGGAAMKSSLKIPENASKAPNLTTLVAAVKAAGLVETLMGDGPFTVFAPTNAAFDKLPKGTVETLVKPENKATLTSILTYHVVAGKLKAADLKDGMKLKTVQGEELTVMLNGSEVWIVDAKGGKAKVETANVFQANGVVHVIDAVLMPK